ncbi:MAG: IPTL-CTERM sorting domain-containing protein [Candidatus Dadabacteria bacterium]|nr:IPTL-CTERM sorting domain-containing protein [Candidatus Dadabacteria bacterium]
MKKFIPFLLLIFLFASSSSYALNFIKFGTAHDDGFWGTEGKAFSPTFPSTVQYLAERGNFQTNPIDTLEVTDENVQQALAGGFGPFNALLFSESINFLTPETYGLINNYASSGGCVIVIGEIEEEGEALLNSSFGYNVVSQFAQGDVDTYALQAGASGTAFEGGPTTLIAANATNFFSNTPGTTIYDGATGVAVFTDNFGDGIVTVVGFDYCCTPPDEPGPILDWYEVVNRAFDQCTETRPIPTLSEWGLIAMAGVLGIVGFMVMRRRKVTA